MASKFRSFHRGPRLPHHYFESQALPLHASSFQPSLNFLGKAQQESFCFFGLRKGTHRNSRYFPIDLAIPALCIHIDYVAKHLFKKILQALGLQVFEDLMPSTQSGLADKTRQSENKGQHKAKPLSDQYLGKPYSIVDLS